MKRNILYLFAAASLCLTSCEKEAIGGTAAQAFAGEWYVTVDAVDEAGNLVYTGEDLFGIEGSMHLNTYNTAANVSTEIYVDDLGNFWEYKVKVKSDAATLTFATQGAVANEAYEGCDVTIEEGKILPGAATNPHGTPADSIVFYVSFSDDDYPEMLGYAKYKVSGYRYTGFTTDD